MKAKLCYQLSWQYEITLLYSPTNAAPQIPQKLTPPYAIFPSGFLQLLGQLTKVGEVTKEKFLGKCDRLAWNCLKDLPIMTFICNKGILEFKSDLCSNEHYLTSRENKA